MLPILIKPKISGAKFKQLSKRAVNRSMKKAFHKTMNFWKARYLKKHFGVRAKSRYGYEKRSGKYQRKKKALAKRGAVAKGGRADMVFTGRFELLATSTAQVRGFPTRGVVNIRTPKYIPRRPRRPNMPNMAAELTKLIPEELKEMLKVFDETLEQEINQELDRALRRGR